MLGTFKVQSCKELKDAFISTVGVIFRHQLPSSEVPLGSGLTKMSSPSLVLLLCIAALCSFLGPHNYVLRLFFLQ